MPWRGIIITGTSGAGKSTLSRLLRDRDTSFEQVKAVTTRAPRADDEPASYVHLTDKEFEERRGSLIIWAEYRGLRYGISREHLADVEARGKVPLLVITPKSLAEYLERLRDGKPFLTVFVDAPDDDLDTRLGIRGDTEKQANVARQRAEDRSYSEGHALINIDRETAIRELLGRWNHPE